MITPFNALFQLLHAVVDDMCKELKGHLRRPGLKPACSDSELNASSLFGEWLG